MVESLQEQVYSLLRPCAERTCFDITVKKTQSYPAEATPDFQFFLSTLFRSRQNAPRQGITPHLSQFGKEQVAF
jgi:hypothetical protein